MYEKVSIEKCPSYDAEAVKSSLDKVLDSIGGLDFVKPGMKIGIKANLVAAMDPDKSATTHPMVLRRLCELLLERGATVVIGDSPGGIYTEGFLKGVYRTCGLEKLVKELDPSGVKVSLNQDFSVKNAEFMDAVSIKTFIYTGWLDSMDAIINVSKLKTHAMMGMSCAVKNMFGTIPGTTKPEYHMRFPEEKAFANIMVDLNEFFKPALYVVDAIDGMEGNGPTAGEKRHIGAVLASKKPYALDMACAELIGMGYADVGTLVAAGERKLGPKDISEVEVVGSALSDLKISDFKRATIHQSITFEGKGIFGKIESVALKIALTTKPLVKKDECIGCKKCFETCPAKAITMVEGGKNGLPQIDRSKCIKCFCCQEFCPKGAMKVHYNLLGKLVNKVNHS
ncbi:DUF362 domain-containing protein [Butyrivibrio sp. INlla14]|uniref:DUF362 domain-containing protein n=1 Tax=Butyrivibrio sp. INlla14 TaxID=1520808 RepID=UPI000876DC6D|nr:DUF362 domain-containing protein [Butyrivibrio sp. INlla14]SCY37263.1 Uncharacterized conserved protein, DUF362 family [Butyrivibrio sp. INlla14]